MTYIVIWWSCSILQPKNIHLCVLNKFNFLLCTCRTLSGLIERRSSAEGRRKPRSTLSCQSCKNAPVGEVSQNLHANAESHVAADTSSVWIPNRRYWFRYIDTTQEPKLKSKLNLRRGVEHEWWLRNNSRMTVTAGGDSLFIAVGKWPLVWL